MGIDATQGAISTGAVEGGSIREPALTIVHKQNPKIKLIATGAEMFPNFPGVVVAVLGSFADKNPKAVESLVRVVVRATALLKDDPKRAASACRRRLRQRPGAGRHSARGDQVAADAIHLRSAPHRRIDRQAAGLSGQARRAAKAAPLDGLFALPVYDRALASN